MAAYEYILVPGEWRLSSFPRDIIPRTLCDAPRMHVFPPIFPSFYDLIKPPTTVLPLTVPTPESLSPCNHSCTPREHSSSLTAGGTRQPTATTRELLAQLGTVRFISATPTLRELTQSTLTSLYEHLSNLDSTQAEDALSRWHINLRSQEQLLWRTIGSVNNPPPYSDRGNLPTDGYDNNIKLARPTPSREVLITSRILAPSRKLLIGDLVDDARLPALSSLVDEAPDIGSGTSDITLCQPPDVDDWDDVEKFLLEVKLLSPDDWKQFLDCFIEDSEGFKLSIDNGTFKLDTPCPSFWPPVLAQIVEQLHTNRAKHLILTDYDRYLLFTLEDKTTVTVSKIFYRDQDNRPSDTFDPVSVDNDTVVMELVLALALLAKRATHPEALWLDLQPVKEQVRKRKAKRNDEESNLRKKVSQAGVSEQSSTATSTTLSLSYKPTVITNIRELPNYRLSLPTGLVCAKLSHTTEPDLVAAILNVAQGDGSPDSSFGSDSTASLTWSWASSEGSDGSAIEVTLSRFIGRGRTWDAFTATLSARLGTDVVSVPAIVKHIDLAALETFEQAQADYPELARVLVAVDSEVSALQVLAARAPGIAPRLFGHWTIGDHILLATEDCGRALSARDEATCKAVLDAYARVHAAGLLHGDVAARHVCGRRGVRLVDWEGAYAVEDGDPGAVDDELAQVRAMLGLGA